MAFHVNHMQLLPDMEPSYAGRYPHSVAGGAGGWGTRISSSSVTTTRLSSSGAGFSGGQHLVLGAMEGGFAIGNEKVTMQNLNDRLASYLETVRNLEQANGKLELKIMQALEKKGPGVNDYSRYDATLSDLRKKILEVTLWNFNLAVQTDNARLAADDFLLKMEYELGMRQTVEADVARLRKILDDTNVIRLHLETDIESLKEELISLKKHHETDVLEMLAQITQAGVQVDMDAPKGQDLAQIMEEMRATYEKMALKNQKELKAWHESKITEVQIQVTENSAALNQASTRASESRRSLQSLQIELQAQISLKSSLEGTLRDVELRFNREMEKHNAALLGLQAELTRLRSSIGLQTQDYQALLNIKMKLEAEIATYRRLLEGGDLRLEDAVVEEKRSQVTKKVVTVSQTLVEGRVVSVTEDVQRSQPSL